MTLAKGVDKEIAYRKEAAWGTIAADGVAAKQLRRVTSQFNQTS